MSTHTCPWWVGYLLASPLRRLLENPRRLLAGHVREDMRVLEPGPGMGFFTVELARLVGPAGRVVAVDLQPQMLTGLARRLRRAGVAGRVEIRGCAPDDLGVGDLAGTFDLVVVIHMLHEVDDQAGLLAAAHAALKPGGGLLLVEPRGHVSARDFQASVARAVDRGFAVEAPAPAGGLRTFLRRN